MLPEHHLAAITQITTSLVPAAEAVLPMLRRPLAQELDKFIDSMSNLIRPDVERALQILGRTIEPGAAEDLPTLIEEARARREADLRALSARLSSTDPISIQVFIDPLVVALKAAMETHADRPETPLDRPRLVAIVEGDAAFRTLHYFLDVLKPVLDKIQPRSALSLRTKTDPSSG